MIERRMTIDGISQNPESRAVSGYAIIFNSESKDLGGFNEVIEPTALEGVLERSDVLCLLNHNEDKGVLARCNQGKGSLTLEIVNESTSARHFDFNISPYLIMED